MWLKVHSVDLGVVGELWGVVDAVDVMVGGEAVFWGQCGDERERGGVVERGWT